MRPMLNIAVRAVRKGGNFIIQNYDTRKFIHEDKEKKHFFIKNITSHTNKIISNIIYKSYPNHIILKKHEDILLFQNQKNTIWVINALDGKNNFIKYFPHFCISIAVIIKNTTELSVIYDPIKNDLFTAVKGQGSQLNGYRTRCSNINNLDYTTVAIHLSRTTPNHRLSYFEIYKQLILCGVSLRSTGSSLLDLAYVASGKIDCFLDFHLEPDYIIAGKLQVRESGCLISNLKGSSKNNYNYFGNIISSPKFIRLITEKIKSYHM